MTINISKRHLIVGIGAILIVLIAFLMLANNIRETKVEEYKVSAKEMKINTMAASYVCLVILKDYCDTWGNAISHSYNSNNMMKERYDYYKEKGVIEKN